MSTPAAEEVRRRLDHLRARISDAGADPDGVEVVAVTKGFGPWAVVAARDAGLRSVGENYADELLDKAASVGGPPLEWHYLGAIQRRKVPRLAPMVSCWQGVWRAEEAVAIAQHSPGAAVFVEVNVSGVPTRPGLSLHGAGPLVEQCRRLELRVRGLMAVGPAGAVEQARLAFRALADRAGELGLAELSMGMTDDLEAAVAEGSTMVRVGRALFGERPPAAEPAH